MEHHKPREASWVAEKCAESREPSGHNVGGKTAVKDFLSDRVTSLGPGGRMEASLGHEWGRMGRAGRRPEGAELGM